MALEGEELLILSTVIHPTSVVSDKARLGKGIVLMPFTVVSPNTVIGNHSQMYAQSFLGHDSEMEEMVFVANNFCIGGRVLAESGLQFLIRCLCFFSFYP